MKKKDLVRHWVGGWKEGRQDVKAGLRIAYSNQKVNVCSEKLKEREERNKEIMKKWQFFSKRLFNFNGKTNDKNTKT